MFKRLFFLLILAGIAFFIYRGVNPEWADNLVDKIKKTYNDMLWKETINEEEIDSDLLTWDFLTGWLEDLSGAMEEGIDEVTIETWDLVVVEEDSEPLVIEEEKVEEVVVEKVVTPTKVTTPSKTTNNWWLSSKDIKDTEDLMDNLFK